MEDPPVNRFFNRLDYNVRVLIYGYLDIPGKNARGFILSCRQAYEEAVSETKSRLLRLTATVEKEIKHNISLPGLMDATRLSQLHDIQINISYSKAFDRQHFLGSLAGLWLGLLTMHIHRFTIIFEGDSDAVYSPHDRLQLEGNTRALIGRMAACTRFMAVSLSLLGESITSKHIEIESASKMECVTIAWNLPIKDRKDNGSRLT